MNIFNIFGSFINTSNTVLDPGSLAMVRLSMLPRPLWHSGLRDDDQVRPTDRPTDRLVEWRTDRPTDRMALSPRRSVSALSGPHGHAWPLFSQALSRLPSTSMINRRGHCRQALLIHFQRPRTRWPAHHYPFLGAELVMENTSARVTGVIYKHQVIRSLKSSRTRRRLSRAPRIDSRFDSCPTSPTFHPYREWRGGHTHFSFSWVPNALSRPITHPRVW